MGSKATKNYGIMSENVNAGAISLGDNSSAKNINKGVSAEEITSIITIIQNNLEAGESLQLTEQVMQLQKEVEQGKVKPKKAEGILVDIIEQLKNGDTIVSKISSIVGTTAGILAAFN